ncbi:hypothetical protein BV25DRAFT_1914072 [Artomyces pyxidatus]|uniref:Uncharacterized protein n=1 Tax=Artomyces pyxidatus TaxID=48021 RepID=A0ACB8TA93_9AGAM|nr:hypothetical protein BV25DRAFT_1914072 [Artomyces pyxidatus]
MPSYAMNHPLSYPGNSNPPLDYADRSPYNTGPSTSAVGSSYQPGPAPAPLPEGHPPYATHLPPNHQPPGYNPYNPPPPVWQNIYQPPEKLPYYHYGEWYRQEPSGELPVPPPYGPLQRAETTNVYGTPVIEAAPSGWHDKAKSTEDPHLVDRTPRPYHPDDGHMSTRRNIGERRFSSSSGYEPGADAKVDGAEGNAGAMIEQLTVERDTARRGLHEALGFIQTLAAEVRRLSDSEARRRRG